MTPIMLAHAMLCTSTSVQNAMLALTSKAPDMHAWNKKSLHSRRNSDSSLQARFVCRSISPCVQSLQQERCQFGPANISLVVPSDWNLVKTSYFPSKSDMTAITHSIVLMQGEWLAWPSFLLAGHIHNSNCISGIIQCWLPGITRLLLRPLN